MFADSCIHTQTHRSNWFANTRTLHCECGKEIWLQGEAASEAHSFRDSEPHPVIPTNSKNNYKIFPKKLRPSNNTKLSTTDLCLPSTAWQWSVVCYYIICLFGPKMRRNIPFYSFAPDWLFGFASKLAMKHMVPERLLQIGATDLTVPNDSHRRPYPLATMKFSHN